MALRGHAARPLSLGLLWEALCLVTVDRCGTTQRVRSALPRAPWRSAPSRVMGQALDPHHHAWGPGPPNPTLGSLLCSLMPLPTFLIVLHSTFKMSLPFSGTRAGSSSTPCAHPCPGHG